MYGSLLFFLGREQKLLGRGFSLFKADRVATGKAQPVFFEPIIGPEDKFWYLPLRLGLLVERGDVPHGFFVPVDAQGGPIAESEPGSAVENADLNALLGGGLDHEHFLSLERMLFSESKIESAPILCAEHPVGTQNDGLEIEVLGLEARSGFVLLFPVRLDQGPHL